MSSIQMFFGGLILGPVFAAQAGLAWYLVVGTIRFFGHWISTVLPALRWEVWPFLRTGYVLLLAMMGFGYLSGSASSSGPDDHAQFLAAILGIAGSFAVALLIRHGGWQRFGGPAFSTGGAMRPLVSPPPTNDPETLPTWALPPDSPPTTPQSPR